VKIPRRFKLLGQTIEVEFVDDLRHEDDAYGLACFRSNKIQIQRNMDGIRRTQEQLAHTFCHELVHWLLYAGYTGKYEEALHTDEALVDLLGGLLQQALDTMEYR